MNFAVRSTRLTALALAILGLGAAATPLRAAEKAALTTRVVATQQVGFEIYLPLQHRDQMEAMLHDLHDASSPNYQKWLTPDQFNAQFGASASQVAKIQSQLAGFGLETSVVSPHHIHVTGSASAVEQALGTVLKNGTYKNGRATIAATQPMVKPSAMQETNAVVAGLSGMIRMQVHSQRVPLPANRYSSTGAYWFDDLKQAYSFPSYKEYNGKGVTIGILIPGAFNPPDMTAYFGHENLDVPNFKRVDIDGGAPFSLDNSFETHLDLQQSGGMAPKAKIIQYNIPDLSDQSLMDGLSRIINDNKADVVSMSFGGPEIFYTAGDNGGVDFTDILKEEDDLMAQGNAQGITFIASSGDSGALSAPPIACFDIPAPTSCGAVRASAQFPASSPHVTGVGGTNLVTSYTGTPGDLNSTYVLEEAFADPLVGDIFYGTSATGSYWGSGGGDSVVFPKPLFQLLTDTGNLRYRTVPDLALHMGGCPNGVVGTCNPDDSADIEAIAGSYYGVIGTSASAPDFAGLTALNIQRQGARLGNENYYIYSLAVAQSLGLPVNVFKTGIPGFNGLYYTKPKGYNRVLGNGTLNGVNFLLAPLLPVAGTPQTPSNP